MSNTYQASLLSQSVCTSSSVLAKELHPVSYIVCELSALSSPEITPDINTQIGTLGRQTSTHEP